MKKKATPRRTLVLDPAHVPHERPRPQWPSDGVVFDRDCTRCPRLAAFLKQGREEYPNYYCLPVPPFGDPQARLLIVGLAPGFHGANATGRPFTGDHAGLILYRTLHRFGFATKAESVSYDDNLRLINCRITNAVKCVPLQNKPLPGEIRICNRYLAGELGGLPPTAVILSLGLIAHEATLLGFGLPLSKYKFGHGKEYTLPNGITLLDSYHCSRYNTNTRRLTEEMFSAVFERARELLGS
jgi:uracil-DNA glycosylase family 4